MIFKRRLIFLGTAKKNTQRAAKQYFRYTLPTKIIESICDKHSDIIKETQVILDGLNHRWTSKHTLLSLTLFRKISNHWIKELLNDPLVERLASSVQAKMVDLNQEYIFFLMLTNFLVPKKVEEQAISLVAYPFIDGKYTGLQMSFWCSNSLFWTQITLLQSSNAYIVIVVCDIWKLRKSRETKISVLKKDRSLFNLHWNRILIRCIHDIISQCSHSNHCLPL